MCIYLHGNAGNKNGVGHPPLTPTTSIGLHLYITPTFLVADHTVSPMLTLNWNVFCHKLAGLASWPKVDTRGSS